MGVSLMHRCRRIGGTLALLGMAFYVVLLRVARRSPKRPCCSSRPSLERAPYRCAAGGSDRADQPAKEPSKQTHCPICSGYAALQFAVEGSAGAVLALPELGSLTFDSSQDHLAPALVHVPQSCGPPSSSPELSKALIHLARSRGRDRSQCRPAAMLASRSLVERAPPIRPAVSWGVL